MNINGMYVGQLEPDELKYFEAEIAAGRARRVYQGAAGFMGLAKVQLLPARASLGSYREQMIDADRGHLLRDTD
jgi:hypothetical protein